jgi:hypothetical protein
MSLGRAMKTRIHPSFPATMLAKMLVPALALAALAGAAAAQTNTGTTIGQFMLIEPDARIAGLGNAGVTMYDGLRGVFYNPASIGRVKNLQAVFSHSAWIADLTYDWVGLAVPLGERGTVYGTVTSLNSGEMDVRTVDQPLGTGERFRVSDVGISLGYGRQVSPRFAAGGQVNFAQETIWHTSASTVTFNVGTFYRVAENGLRIGSSLSNFGTRGAFNGRDLRFVYDNLPGQNGDNSTLPGERFTDSFSVPVMFRVGLGLPVRLNDANRLMFAADAFHPNDNSESVSLGAEYSLKDLVAVRAGWQNLFLHDSEVGLTLGAGLRARFEESQYRVDYAWADQGRLGSSHRLTLGLGF